MHSCTTTGHLWLKALEQTTCLTNPFSEIYLLVNLESDDNSWGLHACWSSNIHCKETNMYVWKVESTQNGAAFCVFRLNVNETAAAVIEVTATYSLSLSLSLSVLWQEVYLSHHTDSGRLGQWREGAEEVSSTCRLREQRLLLRCKLHKPSFELEKTLTHTVLVLAAMLFCFLQCRLTAENHGKQYKLRKTVESMCFFCLPTVETILKPTSVKKIFIFTLLRKMFGHFNWSLTQPTSQN